MLLYLGQFDTAMKAARDMKATLPERVLRNAVMAQYFESFFPTDIHVLVRFGRWSEILKLEVPTDSQVLVG
jgi:hypothetical protein